MASILDNILGDFDIPHLITIINELEWRLSIRDEKLKKREDALAEKDKEIEKLSRKTYELNNKIVDKNLKLNKVYDEIEELNKKYNNALDDVNNIGLQYSDKVLELEKANSKVVALESKVSNLLTENANLKNELLNRNLKEFHSENCDELRKELEKTKEALDAEKRLHEKDNNANEVMIRDLRIKYSFNNKKSLKGIVDELKEKLYNERNFAKDISEINRSLNQSLIDVKKERDEAIESYEKMRKQCEELTIELKRYEGKETSDNKEPELTIKESELIINDIYFNKFNPDTQRDILLNLIRELLCGNFEIMSNIENSIVLLINTGIYNIRLIIKLKDKLIFQTIDDILNNNQIINLQYQ